jgi:hypothetical protein
MKALSVSQRSSGQRVARDSAGAPEDSSLIFRLTNPHNDGTFSFRRLHGIGRGRAGLSGSGIMSPAARNGADGRKGPGPGFALLFDVRPCRVAEAAKNVGEIARRGLACLINNAGLSDFRAFTTALTISAINSGKRDRSVRRHAGLLPLLGDAGPGHPKINISPVGGKIVMPLPRRLCGE